MAGTDKMDAIALLKKDHRTAEDLFADYEKASGDGAKQKLAEQNLPRAVGPRRDRGGNLLPCLRRQDRRGRLKEAYVEHDGAKVMIAEILGGEPSDEFYDSKVKVLGEEIKHHIGEEEKRLEGIFAQARKAGLDMDALGDQLAARKQS